MPVTVTPEPATAAVAFPRKKWTHRECELAERAGVFDGQRYESVTAYASIERVAPLTSPETSFRLAGLE